jgi:hypothetical protein
MIVQINSSLKKEDPMGSEPWHPNFNMQYTSLVQILDQFDSKVVFTATFVLYKIIVKFAIMKIY